MQYGPSLLFQQNSRCLIHSDSAVAHVQLAYKLIFSIELLIDAEMCVWHFAGGHGVATNHTLAHDHYLDAHDAGQWRAPYALAMTHQQGWGVQPNCSKAQRYIQTFIKERSPWTDQMDEAVLALDAGLLFSNSYCSNKH